MTGPDLAMDVALALALPFLAWRALVSDELERAVVLFIAFGLLSAVAWARLSAPDVALVEAAVGTGLTGALLVSALGRAKGASVPLRFSLHGFALSAALGLLALGLGLIVFELPAEAPGLVDEVLAALHDEVTHPVTAVLLDFRGYDTLLEIGVLLTAAIACVLQARQAPPSEPSDRVHPLLLTLVRGLVPLVLLVSGYLLWSGAHAPGGAFQAGAVIAGAGLLLLLSRTMRPPSLSASWVRAGLTIGPGVFLIVGAALLLAERALLDYPPEWTGELILVIEAALTLSIALVLSSFFAAVAQLDASAAQASRKDQA